MLLIKISPPPCTHIYTSSPGNRPGEGGDVQTSVFRSSTWAACDPICSWIRDPVDEGSCSPGQYLDCMWVGTGRHLPPGPWGPRERRSSSARPCGHIHIHTCVCWASWALCLVLWLSLARQAGAGGAGGERLQGPGETPVAPGVDSPCVGFRTHSQRRFCSCQWRSTQENNLVWEFCF